VYLLPFVAIVLFAVVSSGCDKSGLPRTAGDYAIQNNEVRFNGQDYSFHWIGPDGGIHRVQTDDVKLAQDERTFLHVGGGGPELHLTEQQSIQVASRDNHGNFITPWFPFFWGPLGGGPVVVLPRETGGDARTPSYRYPPSDSFGPGETLGGSVPSSQPRPPDYTRLPNARNTVGGQAGGTGGGAAATGKGAASVAGQSGGAGAGSAATSKGGFQTGPNAYSETRSAPSSIGAKPSNDGAAQPRVGASGAASAGALRSPAAGSSGAKSPSMPSMGSKGISGGRR
jgi:hypothetical protein